MNSVTYRPLGDSAVRVAFGDTIDPETFEHVRRLHAMLAQDPIPGVAECVLSYAVLAVHYAPTIVDYAALCDALEDRRRRAQTTTLPAVREIEIPVAYGASNGPDIEFVAEKHGITCDEVIRLHSGAEYLVYTLGFLPGFAYLGGLPPELETPRRATPRTRVPAGSVAIGGTQTGVYPTDSPGGWHIIGRTEFTLYDMGRVPRALLAAGDRVRFISVKRLPE